MGWFSKTKETLRNAVAIPSNIIAPSPRPSSQFMRGGNNKTFAKWNPALRSTKKDVAASWQQSAARAVDLQQNSGWVTGMMDQSIANVVGNGLRLNYVPDPVALGMTPEQAREFARGVENRFNTWANSAEECDIEGRRTFGQMQAVQFRCWYPFGEHLAEMPYRRRIGNVYGTKVRLLLPLQMSRRSEPLNNLEMGVYMNGDRYPIGYLAKKDDPFTGEVEYPISARDFYGRKRVLHTFDGMPGQVRGITPLVSFLQVAKQFDQLMDAGLMSHIVQQLFALAITSDAPTEDALTAMLTQKEIAKLKGDASVYDVWLDAMAGYYEGDPLDLGANARVAHLFPGQKIEPVSPEISVQSIKEHSIILLREMARAFGLTYESATGDYEGATYSSVRSATGEIFPITLYRRKHIIAPFCQNVFECWLEEDIEAGNTIIPGGVDAFYDRRALIARAAWVGTPKPQADDLKTAKAHQIWAMLGVLPDAVIANELGLDIEEVYQMRQSEQEMRQKYGLREPEFGVNQTEEPDDEGGSKKESKE